MAKAYSLDPPATKVFRPDPNLTGRSGKNLMIAALCAAVVALLWFMLRPPSADDIAWATARALERLDIKTLLRLSRNDEVRLLGYSEDSVRKLLSDSLRSDQPLPRLEVSQHSASPDQVQYAYEPKDKALVRGRRFPLYFLVVNGPDVGWKLSLSSLVRSTFFIRAERGDILGPSKSFKEAALKVGVVGLRDNTEGYHYFDGREPHTEPPWPPRKVD